MRTSILISVFLACLAVGWAQTQNDRADEARQVWERAIEAKGGRHRLEEIENLLMVIPRRGDPERPVWVDLWVFPEKFWWWHDFLGGYLGLRLSVRNDLGMWATSGNLSGPLREYSEGTQWGPPSESDDHYFTEVQLLNLLETRWIKPELHDLESERIGWRSYHVVTGTFGDRSEGHYAQRLQYFIDKETYLVRRIRTETVFRATRTWGPSVEEVDFEDYRSVDGIMMSHKISRKSENADTSVYNWQLSFNVDFDPAVFERQPALEDGPYAWRSRAGTTEVSGRDGGSGADAAQTPWAAGLDEVFVDVVVTDARGDRITTLSAEDFEVLEDGAPRGLHSFERVETPFRVLVIDECSGGPQWDELQNYYYGDQQGELFAFWSPKLPLQLATLDLIRGFGDPERVALAEFDDDSTLLLGWPDQGGPRQPVSLRAVEEATGLECAYRDGATTGRFEEKIEWIASQLDGVSGRTAVVWIGPPKNLPGVRDHVLPRIRTQDAVEVAVRFEDQPAVERIRRKIVDMGASFVFVLADEEFRAPPPEASARLELRYRALHHWANESGGELILLRRIDQVRELLDRLNREPPTSYRLSYLSSRAIDGTRDGRLDLRVPERQFDVRQYRRFSPE